MNESLLIYEALQRFAASVTAKMTQLVRGEAEDQIRSPFEQLMKDAAAAFSWKVVCTGETPLPDRLGRPDFALHLNDLLAGYVELKAPGSGANTVRFKGHNRAQWRRFSVIPNILYTDGNEWALYRSGKRVGKILRLSGDVASDGKDAVTAKDAHAVESLLRDFFEWQPFIPTGRKGKIDLKGFAALIAPLCRMLRDDVRDALKDLHSPLVQLAKDWRQLLFPEASDEQFADAYAQTVAFALLLGRSEGADPLSLASAEAALAAEHSLLSRALQVLTDPGARAEIAASLDLLIRVIAVVPSDTLSGPRNSQKAKDPWLYFYEDFLAHYDPNLRKNAGVYYTPVEVVRCQVRLIDDLLVNRLGKPLGFSDPEIITLDPAAGTGTYLLGVIEHALSRVEAEQGPGAVAGQATALAKNLYSFELMVGPYAVTELRLSRALRDRGAILPEGGAHVYLTDTLESPHAEPPALPFYLKPISEQHEKALKVKKEVPVIVCLGNPPYDRHDAMDAKNKSRSGGWVQWGDSGERRDAILKDFIDPATAAGHGVHIRNLYNLYVYFWRWALWKVFEHETASGPGVVSFITASSYLDGDTFLGMREHMRRLCDEIWILDLGGEGRGTRRTENVFAIQTPVTIAIAVRAKAANKDRPAKIHYTRIEGDRLSKLAALDAITDLQEVNWQDCPLDWQAPFRPAGEGNYFNWPLLTDLMPWQHSGCKIHRTWPICHDLETLKSRWSALLSSENMRVAFRETGDRKVDQGYDSLDGIPQTPLSKLPKDTALPKTERYAYRSFDRQWVMADSRIGDRFRPDLWRVHSERQVYLSTTLQRPLSLGPALTSAAIIPDLNHFCNRGAKDTIPLYRTADAKEANILPGLLSLLGKAFNRKVSPEDFLAYVYGTQAQAAFTETFQKELETRELRVPITKDAALFEKLRAHGAHLLWLHCYGERFLPEGKSRGHIPPGKAKCTKAIPGDAAGYPETFTFSDETQTLQVGEGTFSPVSPAVFAFEVSGLKVVKSWLKYRMKKGAGKKSSPLDDIRPECWTSQFTTELLELLWVLEATLASYPKQEKLLKTLIAGDCFQADEFPKVPELMRKPPKPNPMGKGLF